MTRVPAHTRIVADGATPTRAMLFLHGIFGSGANWRSFARRLVTARPDWMAVLVDLRMHGASQDFPAPHDVRSAATDLEAIAGQLDIPIRGVVGHSFGGKVAMAYLARHSSHLDEAWILDSMPGARPDGRGSETTLSVLKILGELGSHFETREAFIDGLVRAGILRVIAQWLAMNLRASPRGGFDLNLDLAAIRALLDDYFATDFWPAIENAPRSVAVHLVIGGKSHVFSDEDRARVESLAARVPAHVFLHVLEDAGHWLHVDDPEGLLRLMGA